MPNNFLKYLLVFGCLCSGLLFSANFEKEILNFGALFLKDIFPINNFLEELTFDEQKNSEINDEESQKERIVKYTNGLPLNVTWSLSEAEKKRDERSDKRSKIEYETDLGIEIHIEGEEWKTARGFQAAKEYANRLAVICSENISGLISGIAIGKRGIVLITNDRARRAFYLAQENTQEFLRAIVGDILKLPEPMAPAVVVRYGNSNMIAAYFKDNEIKVDYLW